MKKPPAYSQREAFMYGATLAHQRPLSELVNREFDTPTNDEIETIAVSVGATGARRPASE